MLRLRLPLVLLPLSFLIGLAEPGLPKDPLLQATLYSIYAITTIAILFRWVLRDAAQRKERVSVVARILLVTLTVFALPFYFFRSRGALDGLKLLAQSAAVFIAAMICYRAGYSLS